MECGLQWKDITCWDEVPRLTLTHEETLEAAIPCPTQADGWNGADRQRYHSLLSQCDYETMVQQSYTPGCMQRRNRYMVDHASLLIAVNDGLRGGTRSTIEYAFRRGVSVLDIPLE